MLQYFFFYFDNIGTFVFAISGALAAAKYKVDIFGALLITFITACGGGIIRDVCIGQVPAGITDTYYLIDIFIAIILVMFCQNFLLKLNYPILFFDALGLGFFVTFGAHKTFMYTQNIEAAIILGTLSGIGGSVIRDILLNRIPTVLNNKEIYAFAGLLGAIIQVIADVHFASSIYLTILGIIVCSGIRLLSLQFKIQVPVIKSNELDDA